MLCPQRFNHAALEEYKTALGSYRYAGQFQQRPAPADGGMLKRHWWGYWQPRGANLPPVAVKLPNGTIELRKAVELLIRFDCQIQSWDMAFKDTKNSDFVVGQVLASHGADRYLLDQVRDRLDFPATLLGCAPPQRPLAGRADQTRGEQGERTRGGAVPAPSNRWLRRGEPGRRQGLARRGSQSPTRVWKLVLAASHADAVGGGIHRGMRCFPEWGE